MHAIGIDIGGTKIAGAVVTELGEIVAEKRMVDGRHALDASAYRRAGWEFRALGRPVVAETFEPGTHEKDDVAA